MINLLSLISGYVAFTVIGQLHFDQYSAKFKKGHIDPPYGLVQIITSIQQNPEAAK
jgi:hypothetical protein